MEAVNEDVIFIVIVYSKILFVNAVISNSPVAAFKLITEELAIRDVPAES